MVTERAKFELNGEMEKILRRDFMFIVINPRLSKCNTSLSVHSGLHKQTVCFWADECLLLVDIAVDCMQLFMGLM